VDERVTFEQAVMNQAPPGSVLVGTSVSPDGQFGASLTLLPSANDYPMDDVFVRTSNGWESFYSGNGCGISWGSVGQRENGGVLRYGDEAPEGAAAAVIEYEGAEHRVPVRHGHFLFVAWDTVDAADPRVKRFE
jgi:hypothetical protein